MDCQTVRTLLLSLFTLYFNTEPRGDTEETFILPGISLSQLEDFVDNPYQRTREDQLRTARATPAPSLPSKGAQARVHARSGVLR